MPQLLLLPDVETSAPVRTKETLCGRCKIKHAHNKYLGKGVTGEGKTGVLLVFSQIETCEDSAGELWDTDDSFSGYVLKILKDIFRSEAYSIDKDFWRVNATQCSPRNIDGKFLNDAVECCCGSTLQQIKKLKPRSIILFGQGAIRALYKDRTHNKFTYETEAWHGNMIPDVELNAHVFPCYDTTTLASLAKIRETKFVLAKEADIVKKEIARVINRAVKLAQSEKKVMNYLSAFKEQAGFCKHTDDALAFLRKIKSGDTVVFDYESSGLKPDFVQHFIRCVSVYSANLNLGNSFMIDTRRKEYAKVREELVRVLSDKTIKKLNQNIKFEDRWSRSKLKCNVRNWVWDTMLGAHMLRPYAKGVTGLKFQAAVRYGIFDYNKGVERHFNTTVGLEKYGSNAICGIDNIPEDTLLKYCSMDSIITYHLYLAQKKEFAKAPPPYLEGSVSQFEGMKFMIDSILAFSRMEHAGAYIDRAHYSKQKEECEKLKKEYAEKFMQTPLFKKWKKAFPHPNIGSTKQLGHVLYHVLGIKQKHKTEKGENAVDKNALLALSLPDLEPYFSMKLLDKAVGTYVNNIMRETDSNDLLHPVFNLHVASTFRSSCNDPNFQNMPIRNKDIGRIIRKGFVSRHGPEGVIIEADLKGAEVSTSACHHHDPVFTDKITNPANDMHKDTMALLLDCKRELVTKPLRHTAKNRFVFAEFYGDWYGSCAETIWADIQNQALADGTPVMELLQSQGLFDLPKKWQFGKTYMPQEDYPSQFEAFKERVGDVEDTFWNKWFVVYTAWKKQQFEDYLRQGYVDSYTGFRYSGILNRKDVGNHPIQGDAYHLNQMAINRMIRKLRVEKWRTVLFNQIHDSSLYDSTVDEFKKVILTLNDILNVQIPKELPWITVPIVVEFEVTPPGGSWYDKRPWDLNTMDFVKEK